MWEISDGDTKFLYTMKLVPPEDLVGIVHNPKIILALFIENTIHNGIIHNIHTIHTTVSFFLLSRFLSIKDFITLETSKSTH